jgi:hypothetical protein
MFVGISRAKNFLFKIMVKKMACFDGVSFFIGSRVGNGLEATRRKTKKTKFLNGSWVFFIFILLLFIGATESKAAMQSAHYVIYENVMHSFDGPVISNVSASVSGQSVIVTWTTDVAADSFVIYSTDPAFATSYEQGTSVKNYTSHSVILVGLDANKTYYYRVRSERVNGGVTTDTTYRSFTTGSDQTGEEEGSTPSSGGGGILIIDKTDKESPVISNVSVANITASEANISWETDEEATSFVEYGLTTAYGLTYGSWATTTAHTVKLINLQAGTIYHFRVISSDGWGNISYSKDNIFTTASAAAGEEVPAKEESAAATTTEPNITALVTRRAYEFISRLFPEVSLNRLTSRQLTEIGSLNDLNSLIAAPILSGEPRVKVEATKAIIYWATDIESNSLVAIAPENAYSPDTDEPYQQIVGDAETMTTNHEVRIFGLTPDTTYHYQLRSKARLGPTAKSRDFTFRTNIETLQIVSYFTKIIDPQTAVFKWVTNKPADSAVKFAPYHNGVLAVDQGKVIKDNTISVVHEIKVAEFIAGTKYEVELVSADEEGNSTSKILTQFSTTEKDLPPIISHIKADSTVFVNRDNKIQTIISWLTNEPAASRVYFAEGVHSDPAELNQSTELNTNYTREHVIVITKFKPGVVYSFRVESIDSTGNVSLSKIHTFMTAKKRESIIQIIMNILENTFGWLKKIVR